jgi:hypothetical protein
MGPILTATAATKKSGAMLPATTKENMEETLQ